MSKGKPTKKTFAPSLKLYPSKNGNSHSAFITEKSYETLHEVLSRVEVGGKVLLKPVSEAYRAKAGDNAPEFEIVVFTKAEEDAFKAKGDNSSEESL
jgi:hypothetical protein